MIVGTLAYLAPECGEGGGETPSPAADIYSLGAILFELVAGRPPFQARTQRDLLRRVLFEVPPPLRRLEPAAPRHLETICGKCLEKNPARRYRSASDLADDLGRFLRGETIIARPAGRAEKLLSWSRRKPASAALAGLLAAILLGAPTAGVLYLGEARRHAHELSLKDAQSWRYIYAARLNLAQDAWERGDAGGARRLLASLEPREGQEDLRDFGWRRLWRAAHSETWVRSVSREPVSFVAYLDQGRTILSGGNDGSVLLCDTLSGDLLARFDPPPGVTVTSHSVSPDGSFLARTWSHFPDLMEVHLWRLTDGTGARGFEKEAQLFPPGSAVVVAFSPDNRLLVAGDVDGRLILWETGTWRLKAIHPGDPEAVVDVAFSPKGDLAYTSERGRTEIWTGLADGKPSPLPLRRPGGGRHRQARFSPDGGTLAISTEEGVIEAWDVASGTRIAALPAGTNSSTRLFFSPDGGSLALSEAGNANAVELRDPATLTLQRVLARHDAQVDCLAFHPLGKEVATGSVDGHARRWDLDQPEDPARLSLAKGRLEGVSFAGDGAALVIGPEATLWTIRLRPRGGVLEMEEGGSMDLESESPLCIGLSPGSGHIALGLPDGTLSLRRLEDRRGAPALIEEARFDLSAPASEAAFSPDGRRLAVASRDGRLRLLEREGTGGEGCFREKTSFQVEAGDVDDLAFSPDGRTLAVARFRQPEVALWDLGRRERLALLKEHTRWVIALTFSPDGRFLATGGVDKTVFLWDAAGRGEEQKPLKALRGHGATVTSIAYLSEGRCLATASDDGTVKLWDPVTTEERVTLSGHSSHVNALAVSSDGRTLLSAGGTRESGEVLLWTEGPAEVSTPQPDTKLAER